MRALIGEGRGDLLAALAATHLGSVGRLLRFGAGFESSEQVLVFDDAASKAGDVLRVGLAALGDVPAESLGHLLVELRVALRTGDARRAEVPLRRLGPDIALAATPLARLVLESAPPDLEVRAALQLVDLLLVGDLPGLVVGAAAADQEEDVGHVDAPTS